MKRKLPIGYFEVERPNFKNVFQKNYRRYALFPNDNAVTSSLLDGTVYEPYLFSFLSDNLIDLEGTNVIEIGANNGHFTLEFADFVGDTGRVYAFEPQRIIFQQLCGNVFLNGFDNVYTFHMGLGNSTGISKMESPNYHSTDLVNFGNVRLLNESEDSHELVIVDKLDSFGFDNVSIIKIDVQGYESYVIEGASETIRRNRPYIFIEIEEEQLEKFGISESHLINQIVSLDYNVYRFQVGIPYQTRNGVCLDCVCIPRELAESRNYIIT